MSDTGRDPKTGHAIVDDTLLGPPAPLVDLDMAFCIGTFIVLVALYSWALANTF